MLWFEKKGVVGSMAKHLFLTGEKQVGKTTILRKLLEEKLLEEKNVTVGGFCTVRVKTKEGGSIHMLHANSQEACTEENHIFSKKDGKIIISVEKFDKTGCDILRDSDGSDLICMDELGLAEEQAFLFQEAVLTCLNGEPPVYGVVQQGQSDFLEKVLHHPDVCVYHVTVENRDILLQQLRELGW